MRNLRRIRAQRVRASESMPPILNRRPLYSAPPPSAHCSDLNSYPIANAVAASAAVPVVFAPVVIKSYPQACNSKLPEWIVRARDDHNSPPMLQAFASAISRYNAGEVPFIKLLDGGLVDNFGLSGFTIARLSSNTAYGPMTQAQAVKLRRALFIVVDAARGPSGDWVRPWKAGRHRPHHGGVRHGGGSSWRKFQRLDRTMSDWQNALIRWRCGLVRRRAQEIGRRPTGIAGT